MFWAAQLGKFFIKINGNVGRVCLLTASTYWEIIYSSARDLMFQNRPFTNCCWSHVKLSVSELRGVKQSYYQCAIGIAWLHIYVYLHTKPFWCSNLWSPCFCWQEHSAFTVQQNAWGNKEEGLRIEGGRGWTCIIHTNCSFCYSWNGKWGNPFP